MFTCFVGANNVLTIVESADLDKEKYRMAIRTVEVKDAPVRLKGSKMNSNADYNAVLEALKNPANKGKAIVVSMEDPQWAGKPKPEIMFAYTLRRFFAAQGASYTAYQSGPKEVTVRQMTAGEQAGSTRKKRK